MDRVRLKEKSKEQIKGNILTMLLCSLIGVLISLTINIIPLIGSFIGFVISPILPFGVLINYLGISRYEKATIRKMFDGFNNFGNI